MISCWKRLPPARQPEIIGSVYDIGPSGATFDPPINLTITYDEANLPAGATEENLAIAPWDGSQWVELDGSQVNAASNTITAPVSHFSIFTVLAHSAPAAFVLSDFDISPAE